MRERNEKRHKQKYFAFALGGHLVTDVIGGIDERKAFEICGSVDTDSDQKLRQSYHCFELP